MADARSFTVLCVELLREGRSVRFRAGGPSMAPAIRDGDVVTCAPVRVAEIRRGDVLLYASERGLTAHRVVRFSLGSRESLLTRGDAPGSPSEKVRIRQVLGRVVTVEREGLGIPFRRAPARPMARVLGLATRILAGGGQDWVRVSRWMARKRLFGPRISWSGIGRVDRKP